MPFPTIDGISFDDDLEMISNSFRGKLGPGIDAAFQRLFHRIDVVSTQLYADVQATKHMLLNSHHKDESIAVGLVDDDPSQKPEHTQNLTAQS